MTLRLAFPLLLAAALPLSAQARLSAPETRIRDAVRAMRAEQVDFLERAVNIPSGTMNQAGVRQVGALFRAALDSLGFRTRWATMPDAVNRGGHLVAEHAGRAGGLRILLIGHLDTVFEGPGQQFVRRDTIALGAGSSDMKGGDAIIVYALKAMHRAGVLRDANVTVVMTGDEESAGDPLSESRRDLMDAARNADVALAFEGGNRDNATVARRGASTWVLTVTGRQAHSSGIFASNFGAVFEMARILDEFRRELAPPTCVLGDDCRGLTFNPALVLGGETVAFDSAHVKGEAASKTNIIAPRAVVDGDLRFLTPTQLERARARMREIVARNLPGTSATITFQDEYPAMSPTPGNYRVLAVYDTVSRALGHGPVEALDPTRRGAGDISFVAPIIDGLDGLGALGGGSHSPREFVDLTTLPMQTERAAVLIYRLSRERATSARPRVTP